jgi:molybdopterin molybdotransferase
LTRLKGFQELKPVNEALRVFLGAIQTKRLKTVSIPLDSALGRVIAEEIVAQNDLPRVDRSAVDGYAVRANDTIDASQFNPITMTITTKNKIGSKETKRIWTGNPIPQGANTVVMLENTRQTKDKVEIWIPLALGENVSKKGEDIKKRETAVRTGTRLRPQHLGLIAALGITEIRVYEKPKVAILTTGNELVEAGNRSRENQVFDANKHIISALCEELRAEPLDLGIARDNSKDILQKLTSGFTADMIITTGGTSVGAPDLVPETVSKIGKPGIIVHGIAMRPGMPTALAVANGKPIVILSGNPVASMIGFETFARPVICMLLGLKQEESRPSLNAKVTKKITSTLGRRTFARVFVFQQDGEFFAKPISTKGSGAISTMTMSNGYTIIPENREGVENGEKVLVHLFDDVKMVGKECSENW